MKIKILQENLQSALSVVQKALPSRPPLAILSSIHLKTTKTGIVLSATDLYFGIKTSALAEVSEEGEIAVLGKQFFEIVSSLPPGNLSLDFKDGSLLIKSDKTKTSIQCQSSEDFPQFPESNGESFVFSVEEFEEIDKFVGFSCSTDLARPVLTAVLFNTSEKDLSLVATDGFRLATYEMSKTLSNGETSSFLIPAKTISEVIRIATSLDSKEIKFQISQELKQAMFTLEDSEVFVRLIEGDFPPYQKIIPTESSTEIEFDSQELLDNVKRAMVFARDSSNIVRLNIEKNKVLIKASSASLGTYEGEIGEVKVSGNEAEIAFNARYLTEYLQTTGVEKVKFEMSDSLKPAMFTSVELKNHKYVVMPFKVN